MNSTMGLCQCGCGQPTNIARQTDVRHGVVRGQPYRFITGHNTRGRHIHRQKTPLAERFWRYVDKQGTMPPHCPELGPCWVWRGSLSGDGYGQLSTGMPDKRMGKAHRISWELHYGPIPGGTSVLHKCDNPPCPNPAHLFLGTQADNMADQIQKGRRATGEQSPNAKVTASDVLQMRALYRAGDVTQQQLAQQYGLTQSHISDILSGKRWGHLRLWNDAVMGGYTDRYLPAKPLDLSKEELQRQMYGD